jgi:hypothetical protein
MSLGIAIKSAEGIVLAADSRVTIPALAPPGLFNLPPGPEGQTPLVLLPATYDSATKLLSFGRRSVGAITFGAGAIGSSPQDQRTAASFLPELQQSLDQDDPEYKLSVEGFAERLGAFFLEQWNKAAMPSNLPPGGGMTFFVGGFNPDEPVGRLYELSVPGHPYPEEKLGGDLGAMWGGQREVVDRVIQGFDPRVLDFVLGQLNQQLPQADKDALYEAMRNNFSQPIPWWLLPLRDCVHIAHFLVKATISVQGWSLSMRGVGGEVDIATITRTGKFQHIKVKEITAEPVS